VSRRNRIARRPSWNQGPYHVRLDTDEPRDADELAAIRHDERDHRCVDRGAGRCVLCDVPMDRVPQDEALVEVLAVGDVIYVPYQVRPGDTVKSIAAKFMISAQHLTQCMLSTGRDTYLDR
jgi:LysM repeat protein